MENVFYFLNNTNYDTIVMLLFYPFFKLIDMKSACSHIPL